MPMADGYLSSHARILPTENFTTEQVLRIELIVKYTFGFNYRGEYEFETLLKTIRLYSRIDGMQ